MITQEDLAIYKKKLEAEKERLMKEVGKEEKPADFGADLDAGDEETDEAEEFSNQVAMSQTLKDRVGEINDALDRLETGNFGVCANCGGQISKDVLDVAPEPALCAVCKLAA